MEKKKCKGLAISSSRNWANMEYEVLVYIFMKLSTMDLLSSISLVCRSWRAACCNPLLWFTLDLARLKYSFDCPMDLGALLHSWQSTRLMQILNSALILGGNNIMCLIFHFDAHIKDEHLIFAAERCPRLKQLVLPAWNQITANGFSAAILKLKNIESLTLPCNYFPSSLLQIIGINCPKLTKLKIMSPFDADFAQTLFIYLPNLKVLSLRCTIVHKDALRLTLMLFPNLEVLNVAHMLFIDIPPPAAFDPSGGPLVMCWVRDTTLAELASKLKGVCWCQTQSCMMCRRVLIDSGCPKWIEYGEDWREDEESCFDV